MIGRATHAAALAGASLLAGCTGGDDASRPSAEDGLNAETATASESVEEFLSSTKPSNVGPSEYLVFEFPDGSRGGTGRIRGIGDWPAPFAYTPPLSMKFWRDFAAIFTNCGAKNPWFERWSHSLLVVIESSSRNDAVVECVRQKLNKHFNVGAGTADADEASSIIQLVDRTGNTSL